MLWKLNKYSYSTATSSRQLLARLFYSPKHVVLWLAQVDSNHRPRAYQARALTTWAMSQYLSEIEHFAVFSHRFGGDDGIRTHDPLLAGQVLSQLSYTPIIRA